MNQVSQTRNVSLAAICCLCKCWPCLAVSPGELSVNSKRWRQRSPVCVDPFKHRFLINSLSDYSVESRRAFSHSPSLCTHICLVIFCSEQTDRLAWSWSWSGSLHRSFVLLVLSCYLGSSSSSRFLHFWLGLVLYPMRSSSSIRSSSRSGSRILSFWLDLVLVPDYGTFD